MSPDGSLRAVIVSFAQRPGANDWSDKRRQLARKPKQLTSLVARGRAVGAYKLSLEVLESDSRLTALRDQFFRQMRERRAIQAGNFPSGSNSQRERRNAYRSTNRLVMGLNIKNDETCLLSLDLDMAGETVAGTITVAPHERFGVEKSRLDPDPPCSRPWHDGKQSRSEPPGRALTGRISLPTIPAPVGHSAVWLAVRRLLRNTSPDPRPTAGRRASWTQPRV